MNTDAPTPPGSNPTRRPIPWALLRHWALRYVTLWVLLALVIMIVQLVLAAVLHEREEVVNFLRILDKLPKIFKALIGGDELMPSNVLSIVAIGYQHPLILTMLMINAITVPTGLLTAQCEQGAMEHLLARPVTRSRIYGLTLLLALASQAALVWMVFLGTAIWTRVFDYGEPIPLVGFARVSVNLTALACCVVGLASLTAVYFNERNRAIGVIVGYLVGSYLLDFASVWLPSLGNIHPFTLFYYCVPNAVLKAGELPWPHLAMLFIIGAGSAAAGWLYWRVRDIYAA